MIGNNWDNILKDEFKKDYFKELAKFLNEENKTKTIFPKNKDLFKALKLTDYNHVKVVILGQDPYHGEGEANGLCFSVNDGIQMPPSLQNIFKELKSDLNITRTNTDLSDWASQGILLLNTVLTVEEGNANSHSKCGWQTFTDHVIKILNKQKSPIVFFLWGKQAQLKKELITNPNHLVLISSHPSPFSARRGFFGCEHFKLANEFLREKNIEEIDWRINSPSKGQQTLF